MNVADAAKNSEDGKTFVKNLAENVALDAGLNGVMEGGAALAKSINTKHVKSALVKIGKKESLTKTEQSALKKMQAKVVAKNTYNHDLTSLEKVVAKTMNNDNVKKALSKKPYSKSAEFNPVIKIKDSLRGRKDDKLFWNCFNSLTSSSNFLILDNSSKIIVSYCINISSGFLKFMFCFLF